MKVRDLRPGDCFVTDNVYCMTTLITSVWVDDNGYIHVRWFDTLRGGRLRTYESTYNTYSTSEMMSRDLIKVSP